MKFKEIFSTDIEPDLRAEFQVSILKDNISRIKIFSFVLILIELVLTASDIITSLLRMDGRFKFNDYLVAYAVMIAVNAACLIYLNRIGDVSKKPAGFRNRLEYLIIAYITFLMCWGSVISLMDQKLYGQLVVFMVNIIVCSILFFVECKKIILPYVLSCLILFIGLPFFQHSSDVLVGHYVNMVVFIIVSFISSRILFYNYWHDFNNKILITKMHSNLYRLSYLDELTCIPNRRSMNDYIDSKLLCQTRPETVVSVIMIDIDLFKQYNDLYGHAAGDKVLVDVAEQISRSATDPHNFAARIGGEEFIYIAEDQSLSQVSAIAEEMRNSVMALRIPHEGSGHHVVTISLGIARIPLASKEDIYRCIEFADKALYKAKLGGRNCIRLFDNHKDIENSAL